MHRLLVLIVTLVLLGACQETAAPPTQTVTRAYGEPIDGFPSWYERVIHVWTNRARADPFTDLASCVVCTDATCFPDPLPPMEWEEEKNHAARFHAANLTLTSCGMAHQSPCQLVSTIATDYPQTCNGAATCACVGGTATCASGDDAQTRVSLFGGSMYQGENIAGCCSDPLFYFYQWLHEPATDPSCTWTVDKGHRWNILGGASRIGVGGQGSYTVQDFGSGALTQKIPAGVHYPETGADIEFRANWYDTEAPLLALVNIDGTCTSMSIERGTAVNGTYLYEATLAAGCHQYYFLFKDSLNQPVYYPTTGSYGIGCTDDWTSDRPELGPGCDCAPDCAVNECGDNGCGGTCGDCLPPATCTGGQCVCPDVECQGACCPDGEVCGPSGCCTPDCLGRLCGDNGCGGSCGNCTAPLECDPQGRCVDPSYLDGGVSPDASSPEQYGISGGCLCQSGRPQAVPVLVVLCFLLFGLRRRTRP